MSSVTYFKEILSAVAIVLTIASFFPYIRSVLRGTTKPHVFSWIIWGSTTLVVSAAQLADGGGVGAWPIGFSGLVTIYVRRRIFHPQGRRFERHTVCRRRVGIHGCPFIGQRNDRRLHQ